MAKKKKKSEADSCKWWTGKKWKECCWPKPDHRQIVVRHGITFGSALALVLSYTRNGSILWAIIHGILSWFYVIYRIAQSVGWF